MKEAQSPLPSVTGRQKKSSAKSAVIVKVIEPSAAPRNLPSPTTEKRCPGISRPSSSWLISSVIGLLF